MTVTESLISFTLAAGLLTLTPGLDTALILRTASAEGSRRATLASLGVITGLLVWGGIVALGLGALLAASTLAFTLLKWLGVFYLFWLGLQLIVRPRTTLSPAPSPLAGGWFVKGMLQNLLNPKVGVFYISFLPQFVPPTVSVAGYSFLLAAIHAVLGLCWFAALIVAMRPVARLLQRPAFIKTLDRFTGCVFLGFGARLAVSQNG